MARVQSTIWSLTIPARLLARAASHRALRSHIASSRSRAAKSHLASNNKTERHSSRRDLSCSRTRIADYSSSLNRTQPSSGACESCILNHKMVTANDHRWVVAFAGARDSYPVPIALPESGWLQTLVTDFYASLDRRWSLPPATCFLWQFARS